MTVVRAKFKVIRIERSEGWNNINEIQTIVLTPVTGGSPENDTFYAATPSGEIKLATVNAKAVKEFDLGAEFYVDFTLAEPVLTE